MHELGHAVGYGQFRLGAERRLATSGSERRRHRRCARDGYWESPVDAAFMEAAGGLWSPSDYGIDDIGEAFAEAFAFWKLHPDWLQEMKPAVYDWFAADGHLAWMDDPGCGSAISTPP